MYSNLKLWYSKLKEYCNCYYNLYINTGKYNLISKNESNDLDLENEFSPFEIKNDVEFILNKLLEEKNKKYLYSNEPEIKLESNTDVNIDSEKENEPEKIKENEPEEELEGKLEDDEHEKAIQESKEESKEESFVKSEKTDDDDYKTLFDIISESELKNGFDVSSFKYLPDTFMDIETKTFGNSINNPFLKIYEGAISDKYDFEDRCQAVRYMQRISYTGGMEYCIKAALSILKDDKYPFSKRYYFFSNNDAYIKLDYEIVNACHKYVYNNFEEFNSPLLYKLLSAQFILAHFLHTEYDRTSLQTFLLKVAQDKDQTINYRAECADILYNYGVEKNYVECATSVIKELGDLYKQNKASTIYTNSQNVHDTTINKSIIETLRNLIQTVKSKRHSGEVLEIIRDKYSYLEKDRIEKIMSSLERIMIDTAKYELLNMSDILVLVWEYICQSEHNEELEKRLLQELEDMDQTCSTGHLSRILNILSGYFTENVVQITLKDQLRSNIFARYTKLIKMLPEEKQDKINEEMMNNDSSQKDNIKIFLMDFNIEEVLYKEFVMENNMDVSEFYETYEKSIEDFFGKLY